MAGGLPPHLYLRELLARNPQWADEGIGIDVFRRVQSIESDCHKAGVTPIYTLAHLASLCGIHSYLLDNLSTQIESNYSRHEIKKRGRNKGTRSIMVPSELLKQVQRRILDIAVPKQASPYAYAYVSERNAKMAAEQHIGANLLITMDIRDFFGHCSSSAVFDIFRTSGYPDLLAVQLTSLSTQGMQLTKLHPRREGIDYPYIFKDGVLPQGAPTSGMLANLVLKNFDERINEIVAAEGGVYTRYSDDMAMSFSMNLNDSRVSKLVSEVRMNLRANGFHLNDSKTKIQRSKVSLSMLGFSIQESRVRLNRRYRDRISCLFRAVRMYGVDSFIDRHPGVLAEDLISSIEGHFVYAVGTDTEFASTIKEDFVAIMKKYRPA